MTGDTYIPEMESVTQSVKPPNLLHTGLGYEYFRCQAGDTDETVYVHQLLACVHHDPHLVFGAADVKFKLEIPWLVMPQNLYLSAPSQSTPFIAEPDGDAETTVHGLPASEYERLEEIEIDGQRSAEVSRRLRRIVRDQRKQTGD